MKRRLLRSVLLSFVFLIFLGFIAFPGTESFDVVDSLGRKVDLTSEPDRIVVTSPRVTEIAFDLGLGERIVGVTSVVRALNYVPRFQKKAKEKEKIGDAYSGLSTEEIVGLEPDLVIVDTSAFPEKAVREFDEMGISVYGAGGKSLDKIIETVLEVGKLTGTLDRAKEIVGDMMWDKLVLDQRRKGIKGGKETLYILDDSIYTVGGSGYLHGILSMAGLKNVFGDKEKSWIKVSKEAIVKADPELILVAQNPALKDMGDIKSMQGLAETTAVKKGEVIFLSGKLTSKLNQAGTKLMEGVIDLIDLIQKPRK